MDDLCPAITSPPPALVHGLYPARPGSFVSNGTGVAPVVTIPLTGGGPVGALVRCTACDVGTAGLYLRLARRTRWSLSGRTIECSAEP